MALKRRRLELVPKRVALLVIECQNDLVHASRISTGGVGGALAAAVRERGVLARARRVLRAARESGAAVIYLNKEQRTESDLGPAPIFRWARGERLLVAGSWGAEVHPALAPGPGEFILRRFRGVDASRDTRLWRALRRLGRDTLVVMGVSTNFAVEGVVRGAVNRGLRVVVPEDCCASVPPEFHEFSVRHIMPLLATVSSAREVAGALRAACRGTGPVAGRSRLR